MSILVPKGFQVAGVYSGVKRNAAKLDLSLVVSDHAAVAAGVYTQNKVFAAPVALNRARTPSEKIRAVVINSGNANACTGERGLADAREMARLAAEACGAREDQALVLSTGVIGVFLPMDKIAAGIKAAAAELASSEDALLSAARGILTTDTIHKLAGQRLELAGRSIQITGIAKGAAMIGPNMATMLGLVLTDAALEAADAQAMLREAADQTFNCISVDGHMSTNDTVLLVANGAAGGPPLKGAELAKFKAALLETCETLARAIPADGEGATHLITLEITGCASREAARQIARTVADSPLVKTAIAGGDPNWGRIVSAAGYAGVEFDPGKVALSINGFQLYEHGSPVSFDEAKVSASIQGNRDTHVVLSFGEGSASTRFWTTDLTAEYIRLNADYRT
ncbi:MAG TPA: bifunctional glutamate N-acetyltransferase/amino-acid acetyltransferase ArgJ [Pirellulales bacterium]|jgi:glutamate N-acetyltransferase/amino-acid N-acetyltransferase|nr:bifunctional glutamate N-acetyltransferase/amino-acid acetyltransferase ArgJ [Pirellulales bacterium]